MTKTELLEIISNKESSGVEFKRDDVRPEQIAREIVAMANLKGGKLFLGVEDDGSITGLTKNSADCERWIMDTVFGRYIDPPIIPYYEEIQTEQGTVAVISIDEGTTKPYAVIQNQRPDIYIRIGSTNQLATREQIIRLAQESGIIHSETLPVSGAIFNEINKGLFLDYYNKNYNEELDPNEYKIIIEKLLQLDLLVHTNSSGDVCSIAGQILFGKNPGRFLHQSGFRIIHYPGTEPDINASSDEIFNGPVAELKDENEDVILPGLISRIFLHLQEILSTEEIASDHITRQRTWIYPPEILRELVVNATIHRDYTKANKNRIEIFSNRIEITSFGNLPNTLTIEKIKAGQQYPRNPILIRVAKDYGFIDDRGLGIRRKVIPILKEQGYRDPIFEPTEDYFKVIILKK